MARDDDGERLAALEQRMDHHDQMLRDIMASVKSIDARLTMSKGAIVGAMGVVSAIIGAAAFFWNAVLAGINAAIHPPGH